MVNKRVLFLLFFIFVLVFTCRLFFAFSSSNLESGAYFHLRQISHISQTGFPLFEDNLSYGGRLLFFPVLFYYLLAFFNLFLSLDFVVRFFPNLFLSSLIFIIFVSVRRFFSNDYYALLTSFIAGFIPVLFSSHLFSVSPLSLSLPLIFLSLFFFLNLSKKNFSMFYLFFVLLAAFTHPSVFFLIFSLLFYLLFKFLVGFRTDRAEVELVIFSFLAVVGVFKNEELFVKLISLVDEKLSFIRRSDHSLQPHLTLARVKSPRNKEALVKFVNDNCNICLGNLLVDKLVLYSSQLTSLGPVYNVLSKFSLSS